MRPLLWILFDAIVVIVVGLMLADIYQRMVSHDDLQAQAPYVAAQPELEARFQALELRVQALEARP